MSKSSQRRISRRTPKTKVSIGTIAEYQRRLDAIQINLAKVWQEGFDEGHAHGYADGTGDSSPSVDVVGSINPYAVDLSK